MTDSSHLSLGHLQAFHESLCVYCSEQYSYQIAVNLQKELKNSLPEIEDMPDFSIKMCEEDEFDLAEELDPEDDPSGCFPFMITQHFYLRVSDISDKVIDPIDASVFEAVQKAAGSVPYFSLLDVPKDEAEGKNKS